MTYFRTASFFAQGNYVAEHPYGGNPYLAPIPRQQLDQLRLDALDWSRALAARWGLDPDYTFSSNIAFAISQSTNISFPTAKFLFHGGVAGAVAVLLGAFGLAYVAAVGIGAALWAWLESFDTATRRH